MAFGNNNQGEKKKFEVNTKGPQFYNRDQNMGGTLIVGYWKEFMTLKICPMLPANKRSESKVYDYETFINTALTVEKMIILKSAIDGNIMNSLYNNEYDFKPIGVSVGANFVEISNGKKHNIDKENICLTIYANVDEAGKASDKLTYIFNKNNYFTNYDHENGTIDKGDSIEVDFIQFYNCIYQSINAFTNAYAHSIRNTDQYTVSFVRESLSSIKTKLGIESTSYNKPSSNSGATFFAAGSNTNKDDEDLGHIENGGVISGGRLDI